MKTQAVGFTSPAFSAYANSDAEISKGRIVKMLRAFNASYYLAHQDLYRQRGIVFDPALLQAPALSALQGPWVSFAEAAKTGSGAPIVAVAAQVASSVDDGKRDGSVSLREIIAWNAKSKHGAVFSVSKSDEVFDLLSSPQGNISESSLKSFFGNFLNENERVATDNVSRLSQPRGTDKAADIAYFPNLLERSKSKDRPLGAKVQDLAWRVISDYDDSDADFSDGVVDYEEARGLRALWDEAATSTKDVSAIVTLADQPY